MVSPGWTMHCHRPPSAFQLAVRAARPFDGIQVGRPLLLLVAIPSCSAQANRVAKDQAACKLDWYLIRHASRRSCAVDARLEESAIAQPVPARHPLVSLIGRCSAAVVGLPRRCRWCRRSCTVVGRGIPRRHVRKSPHCLPAFRRAGEHAPLHGRRKCSPGSPAGTGQGLACQLFGRKFST